MTGNFSKLFFYVLCYCNYTFGKGLETKNIIYSNKNYIENMRDVILSSKLRFWGHF